MSVLHMDSKRKCWTLSNHWRCRICQHWDIFSRQMICIAWKLSKLAVAATIALINSVWGWNLLNCEHSSVMWSPSSLWLYFLPKTLDPNLVCILQWPMLKSNSSTIVLDGKVERNRHTTVSFSWRCKQCMFMLTLQNLDTTVWFMAENKVLTWKCLCVHVFVWAYVFVFVCESFGMCVFSCQELVVTIISSPTYCHLSSNLALTLPLFLPRSYYTFLQVAYMYVLSASPKALNQWAAGVQTILMR